MAIKKVNNWKKPSYYLGKLSLDPDPRGSSRYFDVKSYPSFEIAENLWLCAHVRWPLAENLFSLDFYFQPVLYNFSYLKILQF